MATEECATECAVSILSPSQDPKDHSFEFDVEALGSILLKPGISNKKVAVISVAGAYRKGKSFSLNFLLRYLQKNGADGWIGDEEEKLEGFLWRDGTERETDGILIWSKPFLVKLDNGEEVVVILMDTQGTFNSTSTTKDCATVFALSTLLSSVQVYNLQSNLQENDLHCLEFFADYGRVVMEETGFVKPFQRLEFLIRDWFHEAQHPCGDGEEFLQKRFATTDTTPKELLQTRLLMKRFFEKLSCFLMPFLGKTVAKGQFKGELKKIDQDFLESMVEFAPRLLSPTNLLIKKVNGYKLTCLKLLEYFKSYMEVFKSGDLPQLMSLLEAQAKGDNRAAMMTALYQFTSDMESKCGGRNAKHINEAELERFMKECKSRAVADFNIAPNAGGSDIHKYFEEMLKNDIDKNYQYYNELNESRLLTKRIGQATGAMLGTAVGVGALVLMSKK